MVSTRRTLAAWSCVWSLCGCILPSFEVAHMQNAPDGGAAGADAAPLAGEACGLSNKLHRDCDACIRENCCDLAKACAAGTACGDDLLKAITPVADFSTDFDPLLG